MHSLIFAGIARVRCGRSAGRAARPAVRCGCGLDVCGTGGMWVARNRCGVGAGQHPQLRGGCGSEFHTLGRALILGGTGISCHCPTDLFDYYLLHCRPIEIGRRLLASQGLVWLMSSCWMEVGVADSTDWESKYSEHQSGRTSPRPVGIFLTFEVLLCHWERWMEQLGLQQ